MAEKTIDGGGERKNEGKLRYDLASTFAEEQKAKVMTQGSLKYAPRNWERGMAWSKVIASLKRHLHAIESGQDYDAESGCLHSAHVSVNADFLTEYYKTYPQGDDRPKKKIPRIGLDIDGVLADFSTAFHRHCGIDVNTEVNHWWWTYAWRDHKHELVNNVEFWSNIEPLIQGKDLPFEPACYCTYRAVDTSVTEKWIEKHGFPCVPIITVNGSKIEKLQEQKLDIFVDDCYDNFVELNNAGICTYLYDRPHNRKYDVGYKRIKDLKELL